MSCVFLLHADVPVEVFMPSADRHSYIDLCWNKHWVLIKRKSAWNTCHWDLT